MCLIVYYMFLFNNFIIFIGEIPSMLHCNSRFSAQTVRTQNEIFLHDTHLSIGRSGKDDVVNEVNEKYIARTKKVVKLYSFYARRYTEAPEKMINCKTNGLYRCA